MSFDEGSKKVLKDSKDEPIMRTKVSNSDDNDGSEQETEAMGVYLSSLVNHLFFFLPVIS